MYETYIVKDDDTLDSISSKFDTSLNMLMELNNGDINLIPGSSLIVPKVSSKYFDYYTVNKGDTLYKIATDSNINPSLLAQLNGINETDYIYPNQVLLIPKGGTILYISAVGDTLDGIAKGLNTSMMELIKQNENIYLQPEQLIVYKYQ